MAGTLGAAAIVGTIRVTAPQAAEGRAVDKQTDIASKVLENASQDVKVGFATDWSGTTNWNRKVLTWGWIGLSTILAVFIGIAAVVYVRKRSGK